MTATAEPLRGVVRRRRAEDLPALVEALFAQQAATRYPVRDPLPIPGATFLHADDASGAFTADLDGVAVGQGCWVGPLTGGPQAAEMNAACADAHGCPVEDLGWVSSLFVSGAARGTGLGRRLLSAVVDDVRAAGRRPCLEVIPLHASALALYRATGWREVGSVRPSWLIDYLGDDAPDVLLFVLDDTSIG